MSDISQKVKDIEGIKDIAKKALAISQLPADERSEIRLRAREADDWKRKRDLLAISYCPPIIVCADCHEPVISGFCCTACGSVDPSRRG